MHSILKNPYFYTFFISMLPIVELRLGLPAGIALGLDFKTAYILAVIGNILPVPFLILFSKKIMDMLSTTKLFGPICKKIIARADNKAKNIGKYELLSLFAFVAIPLPGTGAWTGSLVAAILRMKVIPAFIAILLGVMTAGVIMGILSFGLLSGIGIIFA